MTIHVTDWDADHLDSRKAVLAYMGAVFEDGEPTLIAAALNDVARASELAGNPALSADTDNSMVVRTPKAMSL